jgi:hypothetical protein
MPIWSPPPARARCPRARPGDCGTSGETDTDNTVNARAGLRSALRLPLFGDLADPVTVARLAAEAEERVPVWVAGLPGNARPLRRAAQYDGFFPVNPGHPDQLAEIAAAIAGSRRDTASPFDIAIALPPGGDPAPYARAGATWWLAEFDPTVSLDQVRGVLRDGPA